MKLSLGYSIFRVNARQNKYLSLYQVDCCHLAWLNQCRFQWFSFLCPDSVQKFLNTGPLKKIERNVSRPTGRQGPHPKAGECESTVMPIVCRGPQAWFMDPLFFSSFRCLSLPSRWPIVIRGRQARHYGAVKAGNRENAWRALAWQQAGWEAWDANCSEGTFTAKGLVCRLFLA